MPFESKAQMRACYAKQDPRWDCKKWYKDTKKPYKSWPQYKKPKKYNIVWRVKSPRGYYVFYSRNQNGTIVRKGPRAKQWSYISKKEQRWASQPHRMQSVNDKPIKL